MYVFGVETKLVRLPPPRTGTGMSERCSYERDRSPTVYLEVEAIFIRSNCAVDLDRIRSQ